MCFSSHFVASHHTPLNIYVITCGTGENYVKWLAIQLHTGPLLQIWSHIQLHDMYVSTYFHFKVSTDNDPTTVYHMRNSDNTPKFNVCMHMDVTHI